VFQTVLMKKRPTDAWGISSNQKEGAGHQGLAVSRAPDLLDVDCRHR
jgi:hypothetical protein